VLHGEADIVTDPEVSRALYEKASSIDKTIKLYPGMWHALTSGEPDENVDVVFTDIIKWLDKRSDRSYSLIPGQIHGGHHGARVVKSTPAPLPYTMASQKMQQPRPYGKHLSGWKGPRVLHRSAL